MGLGISRLDGEDYDEDHIGTWMYKLGPESRRGRVFLRKYDSGDKALGDPTHLGHFSVLIDFGGWSQYDHEAHVPGEIPTTFSGYVIYLGLQRVKRANVGGSPVYTVYTEPICTIQSDLDLENEATPIGQIRNINETEDPKLWPVEFAATIRYKREHSIKNSTSDKKYTFWDAYVLSMRHSKTKGVSLGEMDVGALNDTLSKTDDPVIEFLSFDVNGERSSLWESSEVTRQMEIWDSKVNCYTFAKFLLEWMGLTFPSEMDVPDDEYPLLLLETMKFCIGTV